MLSSTSGPEPDSHLLGQHKRVRAMLLAGADLIHTMSEPGVWSKSDVSRLSTHICIRTSDTSYLSYSPVRIFPAQQILSVIHLTMNLTNLLPTQLEHILGRYGAVIVERTGTDTEQALANLTPWRDNVFLVPQTITNDVSSTKVRLFLKRGMSVRYLLPAPVVEYIESHHLYIDDAGVHGQTPEAAAAEKAKPLGVPGQPSPTPLNGAASGSGSQQQQS